MKELTAYNRGSNLVPRAFLDKNVGLKFVPRICTGLSKTERLKLILYQQDIFNRKERNSKQMTTDFGFRVRKLHNLIC